MIIGTYDHVFIGTQLKLVPRALAPYGLSTGILPPTCGRAGGFRTLRQVVGGGCAQHYSYTTSRAALRRVVGQVPSPARHHRCLASSKLAGPPEGVGPRAASSLLFVFICFRAFSVLLAPLSGEHREV